MAWIALLFGVFLAVMAAFNLRSAAGGVQQGRLAPCPPKPNCVCSLETDPEHAIAPLKARGAHPLQGLEKVVREMPRTKIVERTPIYLHATFRSRVFQFLDDVEFLYVPEEGVVHVRSASRVGYRDFGVNRERIEAIRRAFNQKTSADTD